MKYRTKKQWFIFALFALIVFSLTFSGIGIIASGKISITTIHIPIIIGTIVLGLPEGLVLSGIFGIATMILAGSYPEGSIDALFQNPLVSVLPRFMIAIVVWLVWKAIRKVADDHTLSAKVICSGFTAIFGVLANAVFVMSALVILYPQQLGITTGMSAATTVITNIIGINVAFEIISAVVAAALFVPLIQRYLAETAGKDDRPIRKTFQKWLLLSITVIFFVMLFFFYNIQTEQERENAQKLMNEKCQDVVSMIRESGTISAEIPDTIGSSGRVLILPDSATQSHGTQQSEEAFLAENGLSVSYREDEIIYGDLDGVSGACITAEEGDYTIVVFLPDSEVYAERNRLTVLLLGGLLCLFVLMYFNISGLVQRSVVYKIQDVNDSLLQIQNGNLEEKVSVVSNTEFMDLSDGINATVNALKETMEEVAAKMNQEMEFAREIQHSVLPVAEQVMPAMDEYEILGTMDAAKEVGGDFFDYFLIGDQKLGVVIADVSGKGVPAALFMMTAKTLIKNFVLNGKSPAEALELANLQLCENNEAGMFVTVWLGVLDYNAGELEFANAGHNPPLLKKGAEPFVYMDHKTYKRSLMLGAMDGIHYKNNRIPFTRGDILYLYTDGVTEANNLQEELYGEERLLHCIQNNYQQEPKQLLQTIRSDIDTFAGEAEQFDDITMVVLKMNVEWKSFAVDTLYDNTESVISFVEENLPDGCSVKISHQFGIAVDEIYSNVVKFSKATQFELKLGILNDMIYLVFTDNGIPYNPLEKEDPDVTLSGEDREIGGLGLFIVKQTMDYTAYQYTDDRNRFTIGKKFI